MFGLAGQGLIDSMLFEQAALAQTVSRVSLKLRKEPKHLDLMLAGIGDSARVVQERSSTNSWRGEIVRSDEGSSTKEVVQQLAMPEMGLASVRLRGSGSTFQLEVTSVAGTVLPKPQILATGDDLVLRFRGLAGAISTRQTGSFDLRRPARIPQPAYAPPLQARAVAPPLGDMAVGSMLIGNRSFVQVSGPPVTLTLNNAPAKDALMALARIGDYGFVYVGSPEDNGQGAFDRPGITIAFRGESYAKALNSVLMASGLQGKLDGRMLLVGTSVSSQTVGPQMSKVIRLNQVSASSAARYLGNLGADYKLTNTSAAMTEGSAPSGSSQLSSQISQTSPLNLKSVSFGASSGPLYGLVVTTDSRLSTVTIVGDPQLVAIAEGYLKQIDLRQRQVALSVKILDIALSNDSQINNSFAFRSGNAFIVSNNGQLLANFGAYKPPGSEAGGLPGRYNASEGTTPVPGTGSLTGGAGFIDRPNSSFPLSGSTTQIGSNGVVERGPYRPDFGTYENPLQPGISEVDENGVATFTPPTRFQYPANQFFDFLTAQIQSSSTKILASPTLIIQEGSEVAEGSDGAEISSDGKVGRERSNEALVSVGTQLVTSFEIRQDENGNSYCQPIFGNAGLTFGARVEKIDDNGFVTFSLSPEISAAVGSSVPIGNCGNINTINKRTLDTGKIRVREGQTLILTGVISDTDIQAVTKWPILGDIPLIGQFFRSSAGDRRKNELVILVTPRLIDDALVGNYGYGYRPNLPAARQILSGS